MTLTLEITSAAGAKSGDRTSVSFGEDGGTIGRAPSNSWVLSQKEVSARHAIVSFQNGSFYIEDTSTNGVAVNRPGNKIGKGGRSALKSGDRLWIDPYQITVWIDTGIESSARGPVVDPFAETRSRSASARSRNTGPQEIAADELDPLKIFDPVVQSAPARPPERRGPAPEPLLDAHYQPPVGMPEPGRPPDDPLAIPPGYDPFAEESPSVPYPRPRPGDSALRARHTDPAPPITREPRPPDQPLAGVPGPPVAPAGPVVDPKRYTIAPPARGHAGLEEPQRRLPEPIAGAASQIAPEGATDFFAELLGGTGLTGVAVTPELMRNFGQILRVVVSGVMDVLRARQNIKEEFRMRQTMFRPADNNPLKFSANVDDALHNLLVKRNPAYLGAVEAFTDAFDDLRDHQLAILAGMRAAFRALLDEFDPDQLQAEFDRQAAKGALALMPAKMRYWDLYREKREELEKDPDSQFVELFGEKFASAYEEQFRRLKGERRSRPEGSENSRPRSG